MKTARVSEQEYSMPVVRSATAEDVGPLVEIEKTCFTLDRLSPRRMRFYVTAPHAEFVVATLDNEVVGYALLLLRRGTQLTRLYSIAILPKARGRGIAEQLIWELEERALTRGKRFIRLEVSVQNNGAIALYQRLGFRQFGMYSAYYEDSSDAIRMQKVLNYCTDAVAEDVYPWYQQTTDFTCGPSALMMAMKSLDDNFQMDQQQELSLWRRATTIFMTSGHGGCHPLGLALAAEDNGFHAEVWMNRPLPLFTDGVRTAHKKDIIHVVEQSFLKEAQERGVNVILSEWKAEQLDEALRNGATAICLISTYAFAKLKAPHWVTITSADQRCFYLHDPDPEVFDGQGVEFQHIPVAREDFVRLASYGKRKIRTVVLLTRREENSPGAQHPGS